MNEVMKSLNDSSKALGKLLEKNMDALLKENVELKAQLADALMAAYVDAGHRDVAEESESVANARITELEAQLAEANAKLNTEMAEHTREVLRNGVLEAKLAEALKQTAALKVQLSEEYRDWMKDQCNEECRYGERLYVEANQRAVAAEARAEAMRAALEMVEWVSIAGCDHSALECPWCDELEYPNGRHADDCARQAALNPEPALADKEELEK